MAHEALATYLNDHLAGSVAALELLAHLGEVQAGTAIAPVLATLHADVAADRRELEELMARLGVGTSRPRQATAWLTAKLGELKLRFDDRDAGGMGLFEGLEALALGIDGKHALWQALAAVAPEATAPEEVDYARLTRRAVDQRRRVEALRLEAAKDALGPS